jgi:hypothetical protein
MFVMFERGRMSLPQAHIYAYNNFHIEIGTSTATASRHAMTAWIPSLDHTGALCIIMSDEMMDCSHRDQEI